jgi:threonine/homoserine/homoserine lactone efflux protein
LIAKAQTFHNTQTNSRVGFLLSILLCIFPTVPSAITQGIYYGLFIALSVGPTIFAIIKYSISYGHRAGFSYIFGVFISDFMFVAMANLAANFLSMANAYQKLIGITGSFLLIGMGLYGYFKKLKIQRSADTIAPVGAGGLVKIAASGFLMNTLNPGVIITWIGMSALVGEESLNYKITCFVTALIIIVGFDCLKVLGANRVRKLLTPRNIVILQRISALCLLGVGLFLFIKFAFFNIKVTGH